MMVIGSDETRKEEGTEGKEGPDEAASEENTRIDDTAKDILTFYGRVPLETALALIRPKILIDSGWEFIAEIPESSVCSAVLGNMQQMGGEGAQPKVQLSPNGMIIGKAYGKDVHEIEHLRERNLAFQNWFGQCYKPEVLETLGGISASLVPALATIFSSNEPQDEHPMASLESALDRVTMSAANSLERAYMQLISPEAREKIGDYILTQHEFLGNLYLLFNHLAAKLLRTDRTDAAEGHGAKQGIKEQEQGKGHEDGKAQDSTNGMNRFGLDGKVLEYLSDKVALLGYNEDVFRHILSTYTVALRRYHHVRRFSDDEIQAFSAMSADDAGNLDDTFKTAYTVNVITAMVSEAESASVEYMTKENVFGKGRFSPAEYEEMRLCMLSKEGVIENLRRQVTGLEGRLDVTLGELQEASYTSAKLKTYLTDPKAFLAVVDQLDTLNMQVQAAMNRYKGVGTELSQMQDSVLSRQVTYMEGVLNCLINREVPILKKAYEIEIKRLHAQMEGLTEKIDEKNVDIFVLGRQLEEREELLRQRSQEGIKEGIKRGRKVAEGQTAAHIQELITQYNGASEVYEAEIAEQRNEINEQRRQIEALSSNKPEDLARRASELEARLGNVVAYEKLADDVRKMLEAAKYISPSQGAENDMSADHGEMCTQLKEGVSKLLLDYESLRLDYDALKIRYATAEGDISTLTSRLEKAEGDVARLREKLSNAPTADFPIDQATKLRKDYEAAQKECQAGLVKIGELETQAKGLEERLASVKEVGQDVGRKKQEVEDKNLQLEQTLAKVRQDLAYYKKQYEEAKKQIPLIGYLTAEDAQTLREQLAEATRLKNDATEAFDALQTLLKELNTASEAKEGRIQSLISQVHTGRLTEQWNCPSNVSFYLMLSNDGKGLVNQVYHQYQNGQLMPVSRHNSGARFAPSWSFGGTYPSLNPNLRFEWSVRDKLFDFYDLEKDRHPASSATLAEVVYFAASEQGSAQDSSALKHSIDLSRIGIYIQWPTLVGRMSGASAVNGALYNQCIGNTSEILLYPESPKILEITSTDDGILMKVRDNVYRVKADGMLDLSRHYQMQVILLLPKNAEITLK